jgi:hypothetical protein
VEPHEWASCFQELFSVKNDRIFEGPYKIQMLRPSYIAELDSDFAEDGMKEFILEMKNNQATGYDGIQVEFRKKFYIRRDGIGTLTNMFNKIKNGKEFPLDCKTAITYPVYKGKGNREKP